MKWQLTTQKFFIIAALLWSALGTSARAWTFTDGPQPATKLLAGGQAQLPVLMPFDGVALLERAGLYDDNDSVITNGDLNSQDYWWTKFDAMMLEIALKEHQPEGRIGIDLAVALRRIDDLTKKYPNHQGIQKWKARFEEIQSKINPDADRGASFGQECPWDESNFAQLWVNFHFSKFLIDQKQWGDARGLLQNVQQNYTIMLAPDRMKNYPEDLRKWVIDSKPEADKMTALAKSKTGG